MCSFCSCIGWGGWHLEDEEPPNIIAGHVRHRTPSRNFPWKFSRVNIKPASIFSSQTLVLSLINWTNRLGWTSKTKLKTHLKTHEISVSSLMLEILVNQKTMGAIPHKKPSGHQPQKLLEGMCFCSLRCNLKPLSRKQPKNSLMCYIGCMEI